MVAKLVDIDAMFRSNSPLAPLLCKVTVRVCWHGLIDKSTFLLQGEGRGPEIKRLTITNIARTQLLGRTLDSRTQAKSVHFMGRRLQVESQ